MRIRVKILLRLPAPRSDGTSKARGKTVSVALSKEQYLWMKKAIANWQKAQTFLLRMEQMSRTIMFQTLPDTRRRKPLSKNVMGIN